jgi:hypothetical protein
MQSSVLPHEPARQHHLGLSALSLAAHRTPALPHGLADIWLPTRDRGQAAGARGAAMGCSQKPREDGIGFKTQERLGRGLKLSAWVSGLELGGGHGRGRNRVLVLRANQSRPSCANEQDSSLSRVPVCRGTSERPRGHPLRGRLSPTVLRDATELAASHASDRRCAVGDGPASHAQAARTSFLHLLHPRWTSKNDVHTAW